MRIGIDCSEMGGKPTGVGRFMGAILHGLVRIGHPHEFVLYHTGGAILPRSDRFTERVTGATGRSQWLREQIHLPRLILQDGLDLFFSPGYWLPLRIEVPCAVAVHDVSFVSHPEWYDWRHRARRELLSRLSARRSRAVLTISEFSKSEIVRYYRMPPDRVFVTTVGYDPEILEPVERPEVVARIGGPLVLSVGSLFQRRRTDVLLRAFASALRCRPDATLWIAGENRTWPFVNYERLARELSISDRVVFSGYTPESVVRALYQRADVLVYLSDYEGFGLPPLEGCACGVPVVTSHGSSLEEVFSEAATLVDPRSPDEVARAIADILADPQLQTSMRDRGRALATRYTPEASARSFVGIMETIAGVPPSA